MGLEYSCSERAHSSECVGSWGPARMDHARDRRTRQDEFGLAVELVTLDAKAKTVFRIIEPENIKVVSQPLPMIGKLKQKRGGETYKDSSGGVRSQYLWSAF